MHLGEIRPKWCLWDGSRLTQIIWVGQIDMFCFDFKQGANQMLLYYQPLVSFQ